METAYTFLKIDWEDCPSIEVAGDGDLKVDGHPASPSVFAHALGTMAAAWKKDAVALDLASKAKDNIVLVGTPVGSHTAMTIKGPFQPPDQPEVSV